MTRDQLKSEKASETMRAFEEGKEVQWRRRKELGQWREATEFGCDGNKLAFDFASPDTSYLHERKHLVEIVAQGAQIIKVREVLE